MKIQVESNLYIESDGTQFIIRKYSGKKDKKGNDLHVSLGYFSTLQSAVKRIVNMKLMESTANTIGELLNDLKRIESDIEQLIKV